VFYSLHDRLESVAVGIVSKEEEDICQKVAKLEVNETVKMEDGGWTSNHTDIRSQNSSVTLNYAEAVR